MRSGELKEWRLFEEMKKEGRGAEMWSYFGDKGHVNGEAEKAEV
jgi:hypothetical protein